jgi:Ca-activated chloride channel family protein
MLAAERQFENSDRPRMIVFITDGLPTVGETNIEKILHNVSALRVPGVRVFSFGVGYDVNTALLDRLSGSNGGVAQYVEPKEDLEQKVSAFFEKVSFPVLTGIALDMGGVETDLVYPRELQDIFKGSQLTILGRYRNQVDVTPVRIKLRGRTGSNDRAFLYDNLRFPLNEDSNDFLPRLWANRRVGWLMEQIRTNGEQKELRDEVVDLGTRFGIVTPYTSYLAVEPEMQPREATMGIDNLTRVPSMPMSRPPAAKSAIGGSARDARLSPSATSGAEAVISSKAERALQDSVRDTEDDKRAAGVKRAGSKTFYLTDGAWIDSDFKSEARLPETVLTFASEAYFDLLKQKPKLAEYFSLAERVVVVFEGRVYRINTAGN